MADVPILWAINPQGLFLALKSWLYTKKCNRLLVISPYMKTGIKKIYCLIFFQLYLGALTCRTNILLKNIFKDIFRQLLNCKILSKIKLYLNSPQIENRFCQNYVTLFSICKPLSLMKSSKSYRLNGCVISCLK